MERKLAGVILFAVAVALAATATAVFAQGNAVPPVAYAPGSPGKVRDWYDYADVALRVATLVVLCGGLVGTFAVLTSLRASAFSQIYTRFQTTLLMLADHPELFDRMRRDEYTESDDDTATPPQRFVANAMVNLYEEAFLLRESRVLAVIDMLPEDYWASMLGSMRAAFRLKYVRTHWEKRQPVFSPKFNQFVRDHILPALSADRTAG